MYWPLGAPRVYAVNKLRKTSAPASDEDQSGNESVVEDNVIRGLEVSRNGHLFATITQTSLTIWQTSPVASLASVIRSPASLTTHGTNLSVLLRPDASIAAVQTSLGFLVTYNISIDPNARVYQLFRQDGQTRRHSVAGRSPTEGELGQRELHIRFRMIIKIDAGISRVIALDEELVVAVEKPPALQCIRWAPDNTGSQTTTELLSRMLWMQKKTNIRDMIYDRAMSLYVFINNDGRAYAVQRSSEKLQEADTHKGIFRGYGFHVPSTEDISAINGAINAKFSLLAVGCANGEIYIYTARDYVGNIPLSHKLVPPASISTTGAITSISYSHDGYCLFVGYQRGWVIWSVYGKQGGSSFSSDASMAREDNDLWLNDIKSGHWISGGSELLLTSQGSTRIWALELAKNAMTGCFCAANVARMLLHTNSSLMLYQAHSLSDLVSSSPDPSLWHQVQIPSSFLANQHPVRSAVISPDGRYIAIAGRRGLAHYSVHSGRWKTFDDLTAENAFVVRGGMCWYQHILIAAVEVGDVHELRLYSREHALDDSSLACVEQLPAAIVVISRVGEDSILVYTYENVLYHFIIFATSSTVKLVQVGQIGLHGIVRAPARVRAVTWFIPDHQRSDGDPSQDVVHASVLFLVDAKLVLLQPSKDSEGAMKYDMRIIAHDVEYFVFTPDLYHSHNEVPFPPTLLHSAANEADHVQPELTLRDSLWYFDGQQIQCWTDIQELLRIPQLEGHKELPSPVPISTDFYPTSIALSSGVVLGIEPELIQRRDIHFAYFRFIIRTQLFLPPILHRYLSLFDSSAALGISCYYERLSYFSHALEILLHTVLDAEVESAPAPEESLLPSVLSFLSSFPDYLNILVQCTRKTEVRSWKTLFAHLPPPQKLFDESLDKGLLKTAGGYLLVLHTFDDIDSSLEQCVRLLQKAKDAGDWDLCKELARFLMALDESGAGLRQAMEMINVSIPSSRLSDNETRDEISKPSTGNSSAREGQADLVILGNGRKDKSSQKDRVLRRKSGNGNDYFSTGHGS